MNISKLEHSCLLIRQNNSTILIDPGSLTPKEYLEKLIPISAVFITHEHWDHLSPENLMLLQSKNKDLEIYSNSGVVEKLKSENIDAIVLKPEDEIAKGNIKVRGVKVEHEPLMDGMVMCENIGIMINDRLFHPGDSYRIPNEKVEVLALPVSGPWSKFPDAINYAQKINPTKIFPIHDGLLKDPTRFYGFFKDAFNKDGIEFLSINSGEEFDI